MHGGVKNRADSRLIILMKRNQHAALVKWGALALVALMSGAAAVALRRKKNKA